MIKLIERALVKDFAGIARADTFNDNLINVMIQQASAEVERITRRSYVKAARVEYHTSYEQGPADPEPQIICLNAWPVDLAETFTLKYSADDHREGTSVTLNSTEGDYQLDNETGMIRVRASRILPTIVPLLVGNIFSYAPRGFQVTYTGGYVAEEPPDPYNDPDPMDDYGVAAVPDGLKMVLAAKIASNWKEFKMLKPFSEEERYQLKPWAKKDQI